MPTASTRRASAPVFGRPVVLVVPDAVGAVELDEVLAPATAPEPDDEPVLEPEEPDEPEPDELEPLPDVPCGVSESVPEPEPPPDEPEFEPEPDPDESSKGSVYCWSPAPWAWATAGSDAPRQAMVISATIRRRTIGTGGILRTGPSR